MPRRVEDMIEYGIFNSEGCVEAQFYSRKAANLAIVEDYEDDSDMTVEEVCTDHELQPANACEECLAEDDEDAA